MRSKHLCARLIFVAGGCAALCGSHGFVIEAQQAPLRCEMGDITGRWIGRRIRFAGDTEAKTFTFTFNRNGTYDYAAGQGAITWTSHQGQFAISRGTDEASRRYPCLVTLQPTRSTVTSSPASQPETLPLGLRTLSQDRERVLRIKQSASGGILVIDVSAVDWKNDIESFGLSRMP